MDKNKWGTTDVENQTWEGQEAMRMKNVIKNINQAFSGLKTEKRVNGTKVETIEEIVDEILRSLSFTVDGEIPINDSRRYVNATPEKMSEMMPYKNYTIWAKLYWKGYFTNSSFHGLKLDDKKREEYIKKDLTIVTAIIVRDILSGALDIYRWENSKRVINIQDWEINFILDKMVKLRQEKGGF